jgi:hypothetical protein
MVDPTTQLKGGVFGLSSGDSMEFTKQADPYAYAQQSPDFQSLAMYDPQGNYLGDDARNHESGDKNLMKFLLTAAAMYGGGQLLGGESAALGGGAADAGMGAGGAGIEAGGAAAGGAAGGGSLTPAAIEAAMGTPGYGYSAAGAGLGTGALNGAGAAATLGGGTSLLSGIGDALGNAPWGKLLGGALGAYTSRSQDQTQTREPWSEAQPLLKSLLAQAPMSSLQPTANQNTAYGNIGSLLNSINQGAGGLLGGFQANATGANNYDRSNPRRALTGSAGFDLSQFLPGLFGAK